MKGIKEILGMAETVIINYSYDDAPTIKRFALSDARVRCLSGPYASGKSSACVMEILRRANEQIPGLDGIRRSRWIVICDSYLQMRDSVLLTFFSWLPPHLFGEWNRSDLRYHITKIPRVDIEIFFYPIGDEYDGIQPFTAFPSVEITGAWINYGAKEIPQNLISELDSRIGRYPAIRDGGCSWYGIIMDTPYLVDKDSWMYKRFKEEKPGGWELFEQPSGLSPFAENTRNLPPDYYKKISVNKDAEFLTRYITGNAYAAELQRHYSVYPQTSQ